MTDIVERLRKDQMPLPYQTVLEAANEIEQLREQVASLQASSGYEASIAQVEIERMRATINAQSAAIERADRLVLACEQHLRDAKHEIAKLRNDLREAGIMR